MRRERTGWQRQRYKLGKMESNRSSPHVKRPRTAPPWVCGTRLLPGPGFSPTSHDQLCDDVNRQSRHTPVYLQRNENVNAVVCPESYRQAGHTLPAAKCNSEHRRAISGVLLPAPSTRDSPWAPNAWCDSPTGPVMTRFYMFQSVHGTKLIFANAVKWTSTISLCKLQEIIVLMYYQVFQSIENLWID